MNGGIPFQTSLRKDSSQAASKILSVYRIQLSSTKSQTCTSVTVERQKAIHTPTMAPAAKDSHQEMEGRVNGVVDLRHRKRVITPEGAAGIEGLQQRSSALCRERRIRNSTWRSLTSLLLIFARDTCHAISKGEQLKAHTIIRINRPRPFSYNDLLIRFLRQLFHHYEKFAAKINDMGGFKHLPIKIFI